MTWVSVQALLGGTPGSREERGLLHPMPGTLLQLAAFSTAPAPVGGQRFASGHRNVLLLACAAMLVARLSVRRHCQLCPSHLLGST